MFLDKALFKLNTEIAVMIIYGQIISLGLNFPNNDQQNVAF